MATTVSFATKYVAYIYWEKTLTYRGTPFPRSPNFCHATPVKRTLFAFIAKMFVHNILLPNMYIVYFDLPFQSLQTRFTVFHNPMHKK